MKFYNKTQPDFKMDPRSVKMLHQRRHIYDRYAYKIGQDHMSLEKMNLIPLHDC